MTFLITVFICPYCEVLNSPDKSFSSFIALSISIFLLSMILIVIGFKTVSTVLIPGFIALLISVILFIYAKSTLKLIIIDKL